MVIRYLNEKAPFWGFFLYKEKRWKYLRKKAANTHGGSVSVIKFLNPV